MKRSKKKRIKKYIRRAFFIIILLAFGGPISSTFQSTSRALASDNKPKIYIVQKGDTIWDIAQKYKKDYENIDNVINRIRYDNNIDKVIFPGQQLIITARN